MSLERRTAAYEIPLRARWQRARDRVVIRIGPGPGPGRADTIPTTGVVHVQDYQLLGVTVHDDKRLRLGLWLRQHFPPMPYRPGEPVPPNTVVYHTGARSAYFSLWPRLGEAEELHLERTVWLVRDEEGNYTAVQIPVTGRRGREDALGPAAGLLPSR